MKVVVVINGLGTGGAERSLLEMLPGMAGAGLTPIVVCLYRREEGVEREATSGGFDVRFLPGRRLPARVRAFRRILAAERPDLVHTTIFEANLVGQVGALGTGVPVLTSLVNIPYSPARRWDPKVGRWRLAAARTVEGWTVRHLSTHIHAITAAVGRAAVSSLKVPPDRITVVERGRDPARLGDPSPKRRDRVRRALGLGDRDEVLLNVGRQEYQKGQGFLLEAAATLATRRPGLLVLIAGRRGHATGELEDLARRLGLQERVRWLGHRDDVPDLLAAADLFVFPSLWEGLGGALIEAMALEVPVVASDLEAVREVVEEGRCALLVPPARPEDLSEAIETLLDDGARARAYGRAGGEIFRRRFTLERSTNGMVALYRRLAAASSGNRGDRPRV